VNGRFLSLLASALFVFYCTAVGVYLLLHPWFPIPRSGSGWPASGFFRGFISGIGLVHLFAGIADVRALARSFDSVDAASGAPLARISDADVDPQPGPEPEARASEAP